MNVQPIEAIQLVYCLGFVLVAGAGSFVYRLQLEKSLAVGTVRTFAQLLLVGYVLSYIFEIRQVWLVLLLFTWMVFWAAHTIWLRVRQKEVPVFVRTFFSMLVSHLIVSIVVTAVIVQVDSWWEPQYFIPLSGMIMGNSMNAISLALERMFSDLRKQRPQVELALCLGGTCQEATADVLRAAMNAGMTPSINALMTVGLVALPGMMTGQLLAGSDPQTAVKYQIIVMLMLVASTAVGTIIVVLWVRRSCFTRAHQLILK
ncbi:MAG: iron export ABC transporter permease subunit FetB [Planctomycetota bacterium]|jgi:putative ABC transport system permease protein|nr:iron export ABC transporter permease subunit FetB [Planctomycetota bacterium]MDP7252289.1 iron export ABC transporter permease subunit FetB [Planctomycetota bacterium]